MLSTLYYSFIAAFLNTLYNYTGCLRTYLMKLYDCKNLNMYLFLQITKISDSLHLKCDTLYVELVIIPGVRAKSSDGFIPGVFDFSNMKFETRQDIYLGYLFKKSDKLQRKFFEIPTYLTFNLPKKINIFIY
jgi:hypothetical protein